jgi:ribosomal-protein-alanine N-acetyltransferase
MMKIETPRLILRKPRPGDWKDIVEGVSDYDVAKMTKNIPHPYSKADADWFINNCLKNWGKASYTFMIELKAENKLIGVMGLHNVNVNNGTAATGSWINKKYWRQGYITEAKIAVNDFAFNKLQLRRLNSTVITTNKASNATQKKVGYMFEGVQRKGSKSKASGKISDLNMYGLLKEDWKKARKSLIGK